MPKIPKKTKGRMSAMKKTVALEGQALTDVIQVANEIESVRKQMQGMDRELRRLANKLFLITSDVPF